MLAAAGCSSGSAGVLVQQSQTPFGTPSATASTTSAAPTQSAATRLHRHQTATTAPSASTVAATTAPRRTAAPAPARSSAKPKATSSQASVCGGGTTSTIQMTSPYRFVPSSLSITRCDSVKVVYADTTGAPHNWKGPTWSSPDLSSSGQSYTYRFMNTGTFNFYCSYHQSLGMTGKITVR